MSAEDQVAAGVARGAPELLPRLRSGLLTGAVWIAGSAVVVVAQPSSDRRLAAAGASVAGIATILVVTRLTEHRGRRYFRSVIGAIVAVSLTSTWLLRRLNAVGPNFSAPGLVERIALPLLVVLLMPLLVSALPRELVRPRAFWQARTTLRRSARPMDWIFLAYATVVMLPALLVGLAHHDRLLFVAQDLGLLVFFVFMYVVGRAIQPDVGRASAVELVDVLLALGAAHVILFKWEVPPLYVYMEAACAGALAVLLLRPRTTRLLPVALAVTLLAFDLEKIRSGGSSTTAIEVAGALALLAYLVVRLRPVVPQWLVVVIAAAALTGFIGFTSDGAALRGQYHGLDQSNLARTFEAHQVRHEIGHSPVSLALGRGFGATINETGASATFKQTLKSAGRDIKHVQEIHLLVYSFLLKTGFLGLLWLAAFTIGLAVAALRALERAARERDPSFVIYTALPLIGFAQALAATSRLPANPLNALALGILVACLGAGRLRRVPDETS